LNCIQALKIESETNIVGVTLARKANGANQIQRFSPRNDGYALSKHNRPFWFPAQNYYLSVAAITIVIFFIIWGILSEGGEDDDPWLTATIVAISFTFSGVFLREILLKNLRKRYLLTQKRLDDNLANLRVKHKTDIRDGKLTIEKNTEIIGKIKQMSEAAKVLSNLPDGHFEVFQACNEYLSLNNKELKTVGIGSPRIAALIKGRNTIQKLHKFHLLNCAQIQSRSLTSEANRMLKSSDKIKKAEKALNVLESALQFYSEEKQLIDSREVINKFIVSIKVSQLIEQAQQATVKLDYDDAINFYHKALFLLSKDDVPDVEKQPLADSINQEIKKIRQSENNKSKIRRFSHGINANNEYKND
jgi:hypothetical protein